MDSGVGPLVAISACSAVAPVAQPLSSNLSCDCACVALSSDLSHDLNCDFEMRESACVRLLIELRMLHVCGYVLL